MTVNLELDSLEPFDSRDGFVSAMTRWFGRTLTWDDVPELQAETERRILELIFQGGPYSEQRKSF